ncbi:Enniatin synthase [Fusarium oxysporum f. sp. cubense race 1]|uniref:Enniatin synthase n=1 Tax=Fusarium oxysporum f. sp. cubense (strain race 1) TaxID=1229664 RepID=N4UHQ6_FUSC1|nr:Enniatin synthase [Fusarium oxysporum f. sp. cubense race 1]
MTSLNTKSGSTQPVMPLLLPSDDASHTDTLVEEVTRSFGLGRDRIENILPSTAFQQDVIDCAGNNKQRSIGHVAYEISNDIDISNLAAAWKDTIDRTPALRTCAFTSSSGDSYQVVLKDSFVFSWMFCTSVDQKDAVVQDEAAAAASGPRCNRFVLLEDPIGKKKLLVWTFSHALVDNTFQERILGRVLKAYKHVHDELSNRPYTPESSDPEDDGLPLTPTDGSKTPETGGIHPAVQFWEEYLSDLNASAFPHLTSPLAVPYPNARAEQHICFTASAQSTWPSIAVCRTALAILLSRYTHSPEALFGVVTEQQQLLANGPTRTVVPFRVHCTSDQSLSDIISAVNANDDATRQFADVGLRNIASTGDDGSAACGFQTVLLVTDGETGQTSSCELHQKTGESELFMPCTNRALLLHCQMIRGGVSIVARYDRSLIDSQQIARLLRQLGHLIQLLRDSPDKLPSAGEVDILTPEDQAEIQSWNSHPIPSQNTLIHKEMLKKASLSPSKAAVCAWDGDWTYSELDNITSRLAALIKFSTPDQEHAILPIYFEKSKWVVASMLAVMKAGHAFTLIDPNDPPARVAQVVGQTGATVALTSKLYSGKMSPSVNAIWAPRVQLLDGYGQSESSSICFVGNISSSGADPNNIGRSVGAHSWIIDPSDPNRLVPIGAIGELVIESPGIARNYIIPPPTEKSPFFSTVPAWYPSKQLPNGLKFYRTGDLARYASDGTVVCLGRMDSQVKIRGQRVELGAVETHLRQQLPDDMSIVVEAVKTSDSPTSTVLVAFLIVSKGTEAAGDATILDLAATKDMSAKLEQVLPRHSIPSCYISIQHMPRTATGKVDRRKLRSIGRDILAQQLQGSSSRPSQLSSPTTSSRSKLEEVWCQCLGLESGAANIGSTFFELGGHSITAIKMVNMARSAGIELKVSDIYQNPTLAGLEAILNGSAVPYTLIPTTTRDGPVEQSYSQGRLWFLDQLEVGALWYLIPYAVRMRGLVDIDALSRALMALEQRHETLRTTFEDHDGAGVQVIHQTLSKELRVVDAIDGDYLRLLEQEQTTPFDLTSEAGWRALLIRLSDTDYVLSIVMHHIISDGWSIDVLRHDLSQLYAAALQGRDPISAMNPLPIQYSDFAMWQKQEAQALEHEKQLDYWKKQLADCSPAKLPTDFPRPALLSGEAGVVPVSIDGQLYQNLREFCNENNTTSFAVLLAAFRAAHYRLTGVDDAVIGTPIANRNRWELESIIGFFVNTQCMRITVDDEESFGSLVRQVRATTTAAFENEDVPFERVVSTMLPGSRDLSRTPLAQLIFAVHSQKDLGRFELQGLESEAVASKAYTRFDIEFHLFQEADGLKGSCNFATDLFKPETVENVVSVFFQILRNGLEKPQGVMVEHRVIVRLMRSNIIPDFPTQPRSAHMFNIAFDGATYEIFFTLLNGGKLVCIDYMTTLDVKALQEVFIKEQINAACMAPALLKLYLTDARDALRGLDFLMAAGDRFDGQDAIEAQSLVRGQCYNGYGPTENGIMSTRYPIAPGDSFINGVPIGRAVNNSGAYVTDLNQKLVGVGVMGELVVTGDGLARGYFDPALNKNRFIYIEVDGQRVRAYRTGDRVRYRVGDGLIEFFGRMDTQFKIRGNRIESAEVEAAMLSHASVRDAAVVVQKDDGEKADLVGFVVIDHDHSMEGDANDNQVEGWQDHFETEMYADIGDIDPSTIGKDFKGWTSMYDGSEIDKAEMQEWLDDTIETLRDGQAPGHVLEVGTGSGMILFNLGDGLQSYRGLEPSKSAAAFTNSVIKSVPSLAGKAEVHVGTAQDISQLSDLHPELVVINSVAQYFPSPEYLAQVADTLVHLPGVKRLFFGDMRTNATNKHFLAARAVRTLGDIATKDSVRQKMAELEEREEELLVEPAFFTTLQDRFPDLVHHVEILPKNMHATNELSAYRYAAVVHIRDRDTVPVHTIEKGTWVDFGASRMDRNSLLHFLRRSKSSEAVAISNIPFAKTDFERQIFESLEAEEESKLDGTAWISAIRSVAESRVSLSVPDLYQLAQESRFRLEVSAARQWSQSGALDAVFHHFPLPSDTRRTLIKFPTDNHLRSSATLANRPLQGLQRRRAALQVRERLQSLLPSYMIPSSIVVLNQMPLNPNGKVDRKELARQARIVPKNQAAPPAQAVPISDIEAILCDEATATFGMKVEISDDFFKLGGHSLLATKLVSRVEQRFNVRVTVKDVFDNPVFAHLAVVIREGLASRTTLTNGQDKQGWSARVAPRTETEIILCDEASKLLGIEVGITDNFFDLGGHSMMATKLAMRLGRRLDTTIVVKDIFDYPVLFQLSKKLESAGSETDRDDAPPDDYNPFELLSLEDPQDFIQREICSQLSVSFESIQDTYQSTQMQKSFLFSPGTGSPRPLTPFYIDFPVDSDPATLVNACHSLVQHIDMFRTVFVLASDQLYQVVLKHLDVPIETIVTNQNVNTATNDFLDEHAQDPIRLGESLIRIAILKQSSSVRVLLRLSHALYDGLSLEPIVRNLHILFNGMSLLPPTQFRRYMEYTANSQEKGFEFWRDVIGDSPMTVLGDTSNVACRREVAPSKALHLSKVVSVPSQAIRSSIATQATVFNSACALVLSKESGSSDVVFGRIVSGRQGLPVNCQDIIGPCTNAVPVRSHIGTDENHHQMLRDMQDQYLRSLPFETLGFEEIKRNCTDWSEATANFACCVTYHNFEYHPESEVEQQRVEMGVLSKHVELRKDEPLYDLAIAGEVEPDGMSLKVTIIARAHLFEEERVQYFLEEVCNTFQTLNDSL